MDDEKVIVCRCEDVTLADLKRAIEEGNVTAEEVKRRLRCGMGLCQGTTCRPLVLAELARATGVPRESVDVPTFRPPTKPIRLDSLAKSSRRRETGTGEDSGEGGDPVG